MALGRVPGAGGEPGMKLTAPIQRLTAAINVVTQSGITIDISVTRLLSAPDADLSEPNLVARQTLFGFMDNKTIKECISGVVLDGDEPHRITRAANGKK